MNVRTVLRECAWDLLETEPNITVEKVVTCAYRRHGDVFVEAQQRLVYNAARDIVRDVLRDLSDDEEGDGQLILPGLNLPSTIAVVTGEGTYYVRSDKATWDELVAGQEVRESNVSRAQRKLAAYAESLETLRPFMEERPHITVADAVHLMQGEFA